MKTILMVMAGLVLCANGQDAPMEIEKLVTEKGRIYEHVKIKKIEPDGISILHDAGTAKIAMENLPHELRSAYGYDPDKAAEYKKTKAKEEIDILTAQAERAEQRAEERRDAEIDKGLRGDAEKPTGPVLLVVVLTAKTGAAGRDETTSWATTWGSYHKDIDQSRSIAVSLRNGTDHAGMAYIEVLWLTNGSDGKGGVIGVTSIERKKMFLNARETAAGTISHSFTRRDDRYRALGIRERNGRGFGGWIVRVVDPETKKVIASAAMREPLKKWGESYDVGSAGDF